jgi:hypothetical protein
MLLGLGRGPPGRGPPGLAVSPEPGRGPPGRALPGALAPGPAVPGPVPPVADGRGAAPMPVAVELKGLLPGRGPGRGPCRWPGADGRGPAAAGRWPPAGGACDGRCGCSGCGRCGCAVRSAGNGTVTAGRAGPGRGVVGPASAGRAGGACSSGGWAAGGSTAGASSTGAEGADGACAAAAWPLALRRASAGAFTALPFCADACWVAKASFSLRTTGASIVDDADRTNSPISWSLAITALLSTPNSFASSYTRTFATALPLPGPHRGPPTVRGSACSVRRQIVLFIAAYSSGAHSNLCLLPSALPGVGAATLPRSAGHASRVTAAI